LRGTRREEPNVLVVDYCELGVDGEVHEPKLVYAASELPWRAHKRAPVTRTGTRKL
jgi:hypothetical protein